MHEENIISSSCAHSEKKESIAGIILDEKAQNGKREFNRASQKLHA